MKESTETSELPRGYLLGAGVFVLTCLVYVAALGGDFIWDDHALITDSNRLRELRSVWYYLTSAFWSHGEIDPEGRTYYRPLSLLSLALDYQLHRNNPAGYHVTNLLLHALNAVLVFALIRKRGLDPLRAGLLSLTWAWFPRLTEAAAWISGRTDVLATTFVLLALYLTPARDWLKRGAAAFSLGVGLLGKEVAAAGVLACAIMEWNAARDLPMRQRLLRLVPLAVTVLAYTALRLRAIGGALRHNGLAWRERVGACFEALGRYVWMLIDGWHPAARIGYLDDRAWSFVALGAASLLLGAGALSYALWRRRVRAGAVALSPTSRAGQVLDANGQGLLVLVLVSVFLVLHLVPITVNVVAADRFLYLPLAGLLIWLAPALGKRAWRDPLWVGVALCTLSYAPTAWLRCKVWTDEIDFWATAFREQRAHNASSRLELGNVYARAGLHSYATALYLDAEVADDWNYAMTLNNLGARLLFLGRASEAEAILKQVVGRAPNTPKFHFSLATIFLSQDKLTEAEVHVKEAIRLYPESEDYPKLKRLIERVRKEKERTDRKPYDLEKTGELLKQAADDAECYRPKRALDLLLMASRRPDVPLSDLSDAVLYAFDFASPKQLTELYQRYRERGGASREFAENYALRMERVAKLRALWPTLAAYKTTSPRKSLGPVIQAAHPLPSAASADSAPLPSATPVDSASP